MKHKDRILISTYGLLGLAFVATLSLPGSLGVSESWAAQDAPPDALYLGGVVRDFASTHPDFAVTNGPDMGHFAGNVGPTLSADGRPVFTASGQQVVNQWYDKDLNPIRPYAGPGLPGGHFDVDVYDEPSTNELYHEHQFDDKYDTTFIDVANDSKLLFDSIIGAGYPNDLRLEFQNAHNGGGGSYTFEAGGPAQTGTTADGFTTTFTPGTLTQLKVNFIALAFLRPTNPGTSQGDPVDRDDAFHIRMYDVATDEMVYEIAVYHHFKKKKKKNESPPPPPVQVDACGDAITDIAGDFGSPGSGAITDGGTFDQWFRDELGVNLSTGHSIMLERDAQGVYEYLTTDFFPIDGRLLGNGADTHNNYFTYSISATFTYSACAGQFFEFASNDDAWVFIDDRLVIDLGGVMTPDRQYVALDRLGLVDGQEYTLKFFYAHRRDAVDSLFHMRTNLELGSDGSSPSVSAVFD